VRLGADYLVIGRPITQAPIPRATLEAIRDRSKGARLKVSIIGTGYVGLVTGACLADVGNHVLCLDVDERKIAMLRAARSRSTSRARGDRALERGERAARLHHRSAEERALRPHPDDRGRHAARARTARRTCNTCSPPRAPSRATWTADASIVDKSTVPVGTADKVRERDLRGLAERGRRTRSRWSRIPSSSRRARRVEDFMRPDRIVIGADDPDAIAAMRELYAPFQRNHERLQVMDIRSAELTKYAANAMLATRISFMNELALLAEKLGADIEQVRSGIGSDPRIGYHFLYPGAGFGGSCFPKDVRALLRTARRTASTSRSCARSRRPTSARRACWRTRSCALRRGPAGPRFALWGSRSSPTPTTCARRRAAW
jgi:UDPglucose 6-dehydrogenase